MTLASRTLFAQDRESGFEVVRYDSGRWCIEDTFSTGHDYSLHVPMSHAAFIVAQWVLNGGALYEGRSGGRMFYSEVRRTLEELIDED